MQKVILVGELAKFGEVWHTQCKDIASIIKLISCQAEGFRKYLIDSYDAGLNVEIVKGGELLVDPRELLMNVKSEDIIITLCPSGNKSKALRIFTAIVLFATGYGALDPGFLQSFLFATATNLALSVVSEMLAPGPESVNKRNPIEGDEVADKLFDGPANVSKQGVPIPLLYGELIVGGASISAEFYQVPDSFNYSFKTSSIQDESVELY